MNRTKIELGDFNWSLVTGCSHGVDVCAVSADCWARDMARRFHSNFTPTLHPERLADRMPRKPSRILVSFGGDMFSESWWTPELGDWERLVLKAMSVMDHNPQHSFILLTKNPEGYHHFSSWPKNAWLGTSITGAESREVQQARLDALRQTEGAGVLWVSYEPMLGPLLVDDLYDIGWLVMGAHNRGKVKPMREWVDTAWSMADARSPVIPVWEKDNLFKALFLPWEPVQELPLVAPETPVEERRDALRKQAEDLMRDKPDYGVEE